MKRNSSNRTRHVLNKHTVKTGPIDQYLVPNKTSPESITDDAFQRLVTQWVVLTDQPFSATEHPSFTRMIEAANEIVSLPPMMKRKAIKDNVVKDFASQRKILAETLSSNSSMLSFTLDAWTSKNQLAFLGITVHWIDDDFNLHNTLFDFIKMDGSHTGVNLAKYFVESVKSMGCEHKIMAITTDNASNNITMMNEIETQLALMGITINKESVHVRCMAHTINLAVQLMIKPFSTKRVPKSKKSVEKRNTGKETIEKEIDSDETSGNEDEDDFLLSDNTDKEYDIPTYFEAIQKIRAICKFIKASPQRREVFKEDCIATGVSLLQLILDCITRWNSTYAMLARALVLRKPTGHFMGITVI